MVFTVHRQITDRDTFFSPMAMPKAKPKPFSLVSGAQVLTAFTGHSCKCNRVSGLARG